MEGATRQDGRRWLETAIGVVLILVYLFPVYWILATSLKTGADIFAIPPEIIPSPLVFDSYRRAVLDDPTVIRAVVNSLVIGVGTMLLTLALAAPAAYGLARLRLRFTVVIGLLLLTAQMLPSINIALPLFVIFSRIQLVDSYPALILADATITVPFAIIILRPFFLTVPGELVEASRIDGSTRFAAFRRIVLPLARPGLITVAALSFLTAWGEFVFGLTLATSQEMQPVTVALNRLTSHLGTRWNDLMAVSFVVALPILILFVLLQRFVVGGLTAGALKD